MTSKGRTWNIWIYGVALIRALRQGKIPILAKGLALALAFLITWAVSAAVPKPAQAPSGRRFLQHAAQRMPLVFVANAGQSRAATRFSASSGNFALSLEKNGLTLTARIREPETGHNASDQGPREASAGAAGLNPPWRGNLAKPANWHETGAHLDFIGANPEAKIEGLDGIAAKFNYFLGKDPTKWRSNVAAYSRVRYSSLYPGVDMLFYGKPDGSLEYDLVVAANADPEQIRLRVSAGQKPLLDADGNLQLDGREGALKLDRPMLYQDIDHGKKVIAGSFVQVAENEYGLKLKSYDRTKPLIIDPTISLIYSTYIGGRHEDDAEDLVLDAQNNSYIVGFSASEDFPVSGNAYQPIRSNVGTYTYDATVSKFSSSGVLLYATFIGGTNNDYGNGIAIDAAGNAYITGNTNSTDFPATANAYSTTPGSGFLSELSPDGSTLEYSSYYNGSNGYIALNKQRHVVIAGTAGPGLTTTADSYKPTLAQGNAGFAAIFDLTKSGSQQLVAATYYGTDSPSQNYTNTGNYVYTLALDGDGDIWLAGQSYTPNLPTTANAYQPSVPSISSGCSGYGAPLNGVGYMAELSPDLSKLVYATYLSGKTTSPNGPDCSEFVNRLVFDAAGNLYAVGSTGSSSFPVTADVVQGGYPGQGGLYSYVGWVAKFAPDKPSPVWSSYFGGDGGDTFLGGRTSAIDPAGNLWIVGQTQGGSNFPVTSNAYQPNLAGGYDGFVSQITPDGTKLLYSTYLGGSSNDLVTTVAIDPANNVYLAGATASGNFPVTADAFQGQYGEGCPSGCDGNDMFFAILGSGTIGTIGPAVGGNTGDTTVTVSGAGFQSGATCELVLGDTTIRAQTAVVSARGTSIQCTFALNGAATGAYNVVVANPNGGATLTRLGAFTVESGGSPQVWTSIIGRPKIRTGSPSLVTVSYGNSGSVDAYFTRLVVMLPARLEATYDVATTTSVSSSAQVQTATTANGRTAIPLFLPKLPAGSTGSFRMMIADTTNNDSFTITATIFPPWYDSSESAVGELTAQSRNFSPTSATCPAPAPGSQAVADCLGAYLTSASDAGASTAQVESAAISLLTALANAQTGFAPTVSGFSPGASSSPTFETGTLAVSRIPSIDNYLLFHVSQTSAQYLVPLTSGNCVKTSLDTIDSSPTGGNVWFLTCTFNNVTAPVTSPINPEAVFSGYSISWDGIGKPGGVPDSCFSVASTISLPTFSASSVAADPCGLDFENERDPNDLLTVIPFGTDLRELFVADDSTDSGGSGDAIDPNGKAGSIGDGSTSRYVRGHVGLPYVIFFENEATASLPAAAVVVTDQLDPTKVDLTTVSLGTISIGANLVNLPSGTSNYTTTYTPPGVTNYAVRIQGSLNSDTGLLKWTFQTIDPATGLPPSDPTVGFLPPDTDGIKGQGSVLFTVMPKAGLATGTKIMNQATVVFDANAPIKTPSWLNTIDATPPVSKVAALPAHESTPTFTVSWSGSDVGSGIASYTIYVSDNGGAYTVWQSAVTTTSAKYSGQAGHSYAFYSIATDGAGNVEGVKHSSDASTTVASGCGVSDVTAQMTTSLSGFRYDSQTQTYTQGLTVTNNGVALTGPFYVVLGSLSAGATVSGAAGDTTCAAPVGAPYVEVSNGMAAGQTVTIHLQFITSAGPPITYDPSYVNGTGKL